MKKKFMSFIVILLLNMIDWCLTPTLAIFQLYRGVTKFLITLDTYKTIRNKTSNILLHKTIKLYIQINETLKR